MLKLLLNINSGWASLDIKDVDIVMHRSMQDISDPASIEASYTLNVLLPFTDNNKAIIGGIYHIDYKPAAGRTYSAGTYTLIFDLTKKYKFKLMNNETVIYQGNFVLDNVIINDDITHNVFNCTLYDEIYDVFKILDYTLADPAETDSTVKALDNTYVNTWNINAIDNVLLTALNVVNSWENGCLFEDHYTYDASGNNMYKLKYATTEDYFDRGGFLPTFVNNDDLLKDTLGIFKGTDVDASTVKTFQEYKASYPEEMYEVNMNVWKTFDCKPYLYYKHYLEFLFSEIYRSTGYKVKTDYVTTDATQSKYDFFKVGNPYYANLIRTCNYIDSEDITWNYVGTLDNGSGSTDDETYLSNNTLCFTNEINNDGGPQYWNFLNYTSANTNIRTINVSSNLLSADNLYKFQYTLNFNMLFGVNDTEGHGGNRELRINRYAWFTINSSIYFKSGSNTVKTINRTYDFAADDTAITLTGTYLNKVEGRKKLTRTNKIYSLEDETTHFYSVNTGSTYELRKSDDENFGTYSVNANALPDNSYLLVYTSDIDVAWMKANNIDKIEVLNSFKTNSDSLIGYYHYFEPDGIYDKMYGMLSNTEIAILVNSTPNLTYKKLLGDDFNILEHFTEFLKTFNLVCKTDYFNKEMYILLRSEYIDRYYDMNGLVDTNKGYQDKIMDFSKYIKLQEDIELTEIISEYNKFIYTYDDRDDEQNVLLRNNTGYNNNTVIFDLGYYVNADEYNYSEGAYNTYYSTLPKLNIYSFNKADRACSTPYKINHIPLYVDVDDQLESLDNVLGQLLFRNWSDLPYTDFQDETNDNRRPIIALLTPYELTNETMIHVIPTWGNEMNYSLLRPANTYPWVDLLYYNGDYDATKSYSENISDNNGYVSEWHNLPYLVNADSDNGINDAYQGMYNVFHRKWNHFVYAKDNKLVKAYFHLPLEVYSEWDFDHFVIIDNNLYMIIEIEEYSFNNQAMKAKMIQITNLDPLDLLMNGPHWDSEVFLIQPRYQYVDASSNNYNTRIISSLDGSVYNAAYSYPPSWTTSCDFVLWLQTGPTYNLIVRVNLLNVSTFTGNMNTSTDYGINSNIYPYNLQDTWYNVLQAVLTDTSNCLKQYITNIVRNTGSEYTLKVTPTNVSVANDTANDVVNFTLYSTYNLAKDYKYYPRANHLGTLGAYEGAGLDSGIFKQYDGTPSYQGSTVIYGRQYQYYGTNQASIADLTKTTDWTYTKTLVGTTNGINEYSILFNYKHTTGAANAQELLYFKDVLGHFVTCKFIRQPVPFEHLTLISPNNGDAGNFWKWDYTSVEELADNCTESEYEVDIWTNYDFVIANWWDSLYDGTLDEYAYNAKCDIRIEDYDYVESKTTTYYSGDDFFGYAGHTYKLKFIYPRRYLANQQSFLGYVNIECTNGSHTTDPYTYPIKVIADVLNDNP